ncbi:MAG: CPBP family intramembrane metalloprotease [Deltaproteobacteria bacterium]|nr:CPBP family intramembrane metalloprotease [Deltaproteobacteria bacterium]
MAVAAVTTALATALSYLVPASYAATAVGLAFLGATWWTVLRHRAADLAAWGLGLGGLTDAAPLRAGRLLAEAGRACLFALGAAALCFPPFWVGYRIYWQASAPFVLKLPPSLLDEVLGQLLVIALPEEAFFRGYLQTALDRAWGWRRKLLGARLGWGWLVAAALFALGHYLTAPHPGRLAVFFPALLFGWLRARSGGVGAALAFHALCNLFSATLARGYGFAAP